MRRHPDPDPSRQPDRVRRRLVLALGGLALLPHAALGQPQKMWRVGVLSARRPRAAAGEADLHEYFLKGMQDLGYREGRNLAIERRVADKLEDLSALASDLVKANVSVIVTSGSPAVRALQQATTSIPVVAISFSDPVASGFAVTLARPGRNITGLSNMGEEMYVKRLELLAALVPKAKRIAWLVDPNNAATTRSLAALQAAARGTGREVVAIKARSVEDLEEAFAMISRERLAVIVGDDSFLNSQATRIAQLAIREKVPVISPTRGAVEAGGLIGYGLDARHTYYRAATFVHKILNGAKPGDLPIEQPTNFQLTINRKTAKAVGVTIPQELLLRADKVIE